MTPKTPHPASESVYCDDVTCDTFGTEVGFVFPIAYIVVHGRAGDVEIRHTSQEALSAVVDALAQAYEVTDGECAYTVCLAPAVPA